MPLPETTSDRDMAAIISPRPLPLFTIDADSSIKKDETVIHELDASIFGHHVLDFTDIVSCTLPPLSSANNFLASKSGTQHHDAPVRAESSPSEAPDRRPLEFSAPVFNVDVLDETGQVSDLSKMASQFQGMFFVAEDAFESDKSGRPSELTCYRRNLWECVGELTLSRGISRTRDKEGNTSRIRELAVSLSAIDSASGRATEVVTLPWRSKGSAADESKTGIAPEPCALNLNRLQQINTQKVTFKFAWKRLQFKHATANNGRRNGLQQYYVIKVSLIAKIESGEWIDISEMRSSPLVVRGRNPKNFVGSKDIPLFSEEMLQQKHVGGALARRRTELRHSAEASVTSNARNRADFDHRALSEPMASVHRPIVLSIESSDLSVPIKEEETEKCVPLELFEETESGEMRGVEKERNQNKRHKSLKSTINPKKPLPSTQSEEKDRLYEYFPIGLDDWLPPVDAVYLPHMDHRQDLMIDMHGKEIPRKLKRYFIADSVV